MTVLLVFDMEPGDGALDSLGSGASTVVLVMKVKGPLVDGAVVRILGGRVGVSVDRDDSDREEVLALEEVAELSELGCALDTGLEAAEETGATLRLELGVLVGGRDTAEGVVEGAPVTGPWGERFLIKRLWSRR